VARHGRRVSAAVAIAVSLLLPGCTWFLLRDLSREVPLERGAISGRLVRADVDGQPAGFGKVQIVGTARAVRADSEGRFVLRELVQGSWPLHIVDDPDGDGWPERTRIQGARLALLPHASTPVDLVVGGGNDVATSGVLLGQVELEKAGALEGTVTYDGGPLPAGILAQVIATRELAVERPEVGDVERLLLGAEATTHADINGSFFFGGLGSGEVRVVALLYKSDNGETALVEVTDVGVATVNPRPDDNAPVDDAGNLNAVGDLDAALDESTTVALVVTPPPTGASMSVVLVPPGRAFPPCEDPPVLDYSGTMFEHARAIEVPPQPRPNVEIPLGAWDVQVCDGVRAGRLRGQVAFRFDTPPSWGPVFIGAEERQCQSWLPTADHEVCESDDACEVAEGETVSCRATDELNLLGGPVRRCFQLLESDCDGDGVRGLPPPEGFDDPLWNACEAACSGLLGAAVDGVTCETADGEVTRVWDCDDDGDGQADVDEPACYGVGLGDDLDGDTLCSPVDLFPLCRANSREACDARANDAAAGFRLAFDETFAGGSADGEALAGSANVEVMAVTSSSTGRVFAVGRSSDGPSPVQPTVWAMASGDTTFGAARRFDVPSDPFLNDADPFAAILTDTLLGPQLVIAGELVSDPFLDGVESRAAVWEIALDEALSLPAPLALVDDAPWFLDYAGKNGAQPNLGITDARATAVAAVQGTPGAVLAAIEGDDAGAFLGVWNPGATLLWPGEDGLNPFAAVRGNGLIEAKARAVAVGAGRVFVGGAAAYEANGQQLAPTLFAFDLASGEVVQDDDRLPQSVLYLDEELGTGEGGSIEALTLIDVGATRLLIGVGIVEEQNGDRAYPVLWRFELDGLDRVVTTARWRLDDYDLLVGRDLGGALSVTEAAPGQVLVVGAVAFAMGGGEPQLEAAAWLLGVTGPAADGPRAVSPPLLAATAGEGGELGLLFSAVTALPDGRFVAVGEALGVDNPARAWRMRLVAETGGGGIGTDAEPEGMEPDMQPDMQPDMEPDVGLCDPLACDVVCDAASAAGCVAQTGACGCVDRACEDTWAYDGDVTVETADTTALLMTSCVGGSVILAGDGAPSVASALVNVNRVAGNLEIQDVGTAGAITIPHILQVEGDLLVAGTVDLASIDFDQLQLVGGNLDLINNQALQSVTFRGTQVVGLTTVSGNTSWCQDDIQRLGLDPQGGVSEQDNLCCDGNCATLSGELLTCGMGTPPLCEAP
jgi:hypothetical protein